MATVLATKVGLEDKQGKIRLRLPRAVVSGSGSLRYISTGLDSTEENLKKAQVVAWTIEEDIRQGTLDTTLERYKESFRTQQQKVQKQDLPNLLSLWLSFAEYKKPQLAPTTFTKDYIRKFPNHIRDLPSQKLTDAVLIRDHLLSTLSAGAAKRTLTYFSACCTWACKSNLISSNPFAGMAGDIRKPKQTHIIQPFTKAETTAILEAFHQYKPHYFAFVSFLFATGCRTGEAIGLRWANVADDCTSLVFSESYDSQLKIRKDTKTGVTRKFPCNSQLQSLLLSLTRGKPESLVFTSPSAAPIHNTKFTNQVWKGCRSGAKEYKGIVSELVKQGKVKSYRCLYNTRHTFISHCLEANVPVTTVAKWVGNSPEVIMRHYAGVVNNSTLPPQW